MVIEKSVEMIDVCEQIKNILPIIEHVFYESGNHCVVIASKWGRDPFRESHENGKAIDILKPTHRETDTLYKLRDAIGLNFTVLPVHTHWHIVFDPMKAGQIQRENNRHARRAAEAKRNITLPFLGDKDI